MRKIRWGAAVGAALLVSIPVAAEAATPDPTTSTSTASAPAPSTSTSQTSTAAPSTSTSQTSTSAPSTSTSTQSPTAPSSASTSTQTTTTPAPAGTSEAYALVLGSILALSHTKASASGSGTSSTADPLELGGNPPASQFGGTQNGQGTSTGALFDTGNQSNQFRLALAPWSATNSQSTDQSTADAMSDIVLLDLGDQTTSNSASVRVLQSKSHASWTPAASSGNSSADGAIISAGGPSGLNIDLLHSESSSSGAGSSYLLSINGNQIGSSGQANGQCAITIPSLLEINCLTSTGGVAGNITTSGADVLTATLGPGSPQALTGKLIDSNTQAGSAPPAVSAGSGGQNSNGATTGSGTGASTAPSGALPFTGLDAASLLALALALGLGGAGLVWWARRTRASVL